MGSVEPVNIVGTGSFGREFELQQLSDDIGSQAGYDPDRHAGMYIRLTEDSPLTTIYRTGKFNITGTASEPALYETKERIVRLVSEIVGESVESSDFQIMNHVCKGELGQEVRLNAAMVALGMDRTEYEPEQFPGLMYEGDRINTSVGDLSVTE